MSADWEPIIHAQCGGVALRKDPAHQPQPYDLIDMSHFAHEDGRPIQYGDLRVCDSCDQPIGIQPSFDGGPWKAIT